MRKNTSANTVAIEEIERLEKASKAFVQNVGKSADVLERVNALWARLDSVLDALEKKAD